MILICQISKKCAYFDTFFEDIRMIRDFFITFKLAKATYQKLAAKP